MSSPAVKAVTGRHGLRRWLVALVATMALVISGSGLVVFAQSGSGESKGPQFVPADAPVYIEARLDMPAGQDEALAQMLTAFPGFADAGTFDMKLDQVISGLSGQLGAELPEGNVFGDILTGEVGIAINDLDAAMMDSQDPPMLIGMAIANQEMAGSMASALAGGAGMDAEATEEMYNDVTIVSNDTTSAAVHADWVLMSNDLDGIKAAIDVLDGQAASLADDPDFAAAFSRLPAVRLGAAYVDLQSFGSFIDLADVMAEGQTGIDLPMADLAAMLPQNMVAYLAAEDDRMTLEVLVTPSETTPNVPVGESELATLFPADTQVYIETRELGTTVTSALTGVGEMMAAQQAMLPEGDESMAVGGLDIESLFSDEGPMVSMLGAPLPEMLDFVVDAGIGAGLSSDGLWLGIAAEVTDEEIAADRVSRIMSLITLFGGDPAETGVVISTEMVGDVEVTNITVPLDDMSAQAGLPVSLDDTISIAVDDGYLLIGMGDYVQSVIAGDSADSLGTSAGYVDALAGDTTNAGVMYVNVSALLTALDPLLSMMVPDSETGPGWSDIAPYATGLDRMIAVGTADDEVFGARITVIVGP